MAIKRIGILTGGGDVPGLNAVIKTITYRSTENGIEVVGLRRGWEALTNVNPDDPDSRRRYVMPLDRENTRIIDRRGGTVLHSSRTNPSKMPKLPDHLAGEDFPVSASSKGGAVKTWDVSKRVLANLDALGIEHLVAIGGDDTLSYATKLNGLGVKIIAIPKTMDNDVRNTEYCIGFSTAITRASDAVQRQRTTVGVARAHRNFPRLRPRRRVHLALHRLRHLHPLCHSRIQGETRQADRASSVRRNAQTRATTRWSCSARVRAGRAMRSRNTANRMPTVTAKKRAWRSRWRKRSNGAPAKKQSVGSDLRSAFR